MLKQIIPAILFICIHFCTGPTLFSQQAMQDGSFSYSYPIRLPPGRKGMQPNLVLVYNSNNGNGICGISWSLAGLPVVSRDRSYAVTFTNTSPNYPAAGQIIGRFISRQRLRLIKGFHG